MGLGVGLGVGVAAPKGPGDAGVTTNNHQVIPVLLFFALILRVIYSKKYFAKKKFDSEMWG